MEWISQDKQMLPADLEEFHFKSGSPCLIQTILLQQSSVSLENNLRLFTIHLLTIVNFQDEVQDPEVKEHTSEQKYLKWLEELPSCLDKPSVVLVMHQRLEASNTRATSLPYGRETFSEACERLYQHRSVAHAIRRKSTAVFTNRVVAPWDSKPEWGPAVVYNCKSDTESLAPGDDIVLSLTHFPQKKMTFAVFYGCTEEARGYITSWLEYAEGSAFDPLFLPMIYADRERRRIVSKLDTKGGNLRKRIIEMETRLGQDGSRESEQSSNSEKESSNRNITQRECDAVNLWVDVSSLENGLESLKTELNSMLATSKKPLENEILGYDLLGPDSYHPDNISHRHSHDSIQARLHDMIVEISSIVRRTSSLLVAMSLATQTESNYLTRKDAWATISIAVESKKDSSHMRYISFLGMIFLPGTFFATLFSMGFFNWIPDESSQVVSPYIAIWMGITLLSTVVTVWRFKEFAKKYSFDATQVYAQFDNEPGPIKFKQNGSDMV
ncbi:hypothetical protein F5B22DRAFT_544144 [Xylaria bambusicola]|uniref:uncharacterized protein n=1 Tax=Xylaria bambusicola TaxID=326684 RepID=UPI0020075D52|nr:uncharacterized protein F5B22DRAFT_544144 [Xylaria bambusicola]KAI0521587.1 hypothetical protein F5B22DRAFT_544144 [Xylaria bambusicola]